MGWGGVGWGGVGWGGVGWVAYVCGRVSWGTAGSSRRAGSWAQMPSPRPPLPPKRAHQGHKSRWGRRPIGTAQPPAKPSVWQVTKGAGPPSRPYPRQGCADLAAGVAVRSLSSGNVGRSAGACVSRQRHEQEGADQREGGAEEPLPIHTFPIHTHAHQGCAVSKRPSYLSTASAMSSSRVSPVRQPMWTSVSTWSELISMRSSRRQPASGARALRARET